MSKQRATRCCRRATLTAQYGTVGLAGNSPIRGNNHHREQRNPYRRCKRQPRVRQRHANFCSDYFHTHYWHNAGWVRRRAEFSVSQYFPDYQVSLNVQIPIRNRSAQADNQRSILTQRQLEAQLQQLKNAALLDVRNTYIALAQGPRPASKQPPRPASSNSKRLMPSRRNINSARSTVYLVIQTQRDLIAAQGTELRALADLVEAKANYERAIGRTLEGQPRDHR